MKQSLALFALLLTFTLPSRADDATKPYIGAWALTIPGGGAGWLGVTETDGKLSGKLLWGGGSVLPVQSIAVEGDTLVVARTAKDTFRAKIAGDELKLTAANGKEFTGKRTPPLPAAPDLSKVKYGAPVTLFNGKDLTGWSLLNPKAANGWSVKDGVLVNDPVQEEGKPHKAYSNLRSDAEFEDFNLTLETNVPKGSNSGIYLRGIYEVQVMDSFGKPLDPHNMGAIYSRITPSEAAEKPAGEWQTFDITLVDRHATVILNGKKIIDNQPLAGCTGGALWSDQFRPGPIYLQGDHSGATYRNIVLKPVVKQ